MAKYLSDAEVFGSAPTSGKTYLSDDEVFGRGAPAPKTAASTGKYLSDAEVLGAPVSAAPTGKFKGLLEPGNIDLAKRPKVKMEDGSIATVRSSSFELDGKEVLLPTVSPDGKLLSNKEAIELYRKTGQHLGKFDNPDDADVYAEALHKAQEKFYVDTEQPKTANEPGLLSDLGGGIARGFNQAQQAGNFLLSEAGVISDESAAKAIARDQADIESYPRSKAAEQGLKDIQDAKGWGSTAYQMLINPRAMATVVAESIPASAIQQVVGGAAFLAGRSPTAMMAGTGAASFATEYSSSVMQSMQAAGVDLKDPAAITKAMNDPKFMSTARARAVKRGIPIAMFDAISMGMAGKINKVIGGAAAGASVARRVGGQAAEVGAQAGAGGAGEAGAEIASGEALDPSQVLMEAGAEVVTGIPEIAMGEAREAAAAEKTLPGVAPTEELDAGAAPIDERMQQPQAAPPASAGPSPVSGATQPSPAAVAPAGGPAPGSDEELLRQTLGDDNVEELKKPGGEHLNEGDLRSPLPTAGIREGKKLIDDLIGAPAEEKPAVAAEPVTPATLDEAAHQAATSPLNDIPEPTQAQKEAGNYTKGHMKVGGLDLAIENPQGSERSGVAADGTPWTQELKSHYGYIKGTVGKDKDHIDTFVKPGTDPNLADTAPVFVIDQKNEKGDFDEHKVMIGYANRQEALAAYHENYAPGFKGMGAVTPMPLSGLKTWLKNGNTKQPLAYKGGPAAQQALKDKIEAKRASDFASMPSFLRNMTEQGRAAYATVSQDRREVAEALGHKIDEIRKAGGTGRAAKLQEKLDDIMESIMPAAPEKGGKAAVTPAPRKTPRSKPVDVKTAKAAIKILDEGFEWDAAVAEAQHRAGGGKPNKAPPKAGIDEAKVAELEKGLPKGWTLNRNGGTATLRDPDGKPITTTDETDLADVRMHVQRAKQEQKDRDEKVERGPMFRAKSLDQDTSGNINGFEPALRETADIADNELPDKPMVLTGTNLGNAGRQLANITAILKKFLRPEASAAAWSKMMAFATANKEVPIPPYRFIRDLNSDAVIKSLKRLTPGQIEDADHGFANAKLFREAYLNGEITAKTTGKLFLWSFLSRGVSPYTQESLFIDSFNGIDKWIDKAARGQLTEADFPAYEAWAKSVAPKGGGQPGAGATHNLNAFGKLFLYKMSQRDEDGVSLMQKLHDLMGDPDQTGQSIRRWMMENTEGIGIDNKVVSFTLLVAGYDDVMVLDRVQIRQLWDDGRFKGRNLYDGRKVDGAPVSGSALSEVTYGARGLLIYEAIERAIQRKIGAIYKAVGRPEAGSVGRYHWETWVADSQQEASHGTLDSILAEAKRSNAPMSGVTAKEGEYGGYAYGARYGRDDNGNPYFKYSTPTGNEYTFDVPAFREFMEAMKQPKNGVVPTKFKVTETGNSPWYERPEVNREKLDALAKEYARPEGGTGEGGRTVRPDAAGEGVSDRAGSTSDGQGRQADREVGPKAQLSRVTQTPAFKRWFGDSKVVDAKGEPLVVYHGTRAKMDGDFAFAREKIGEAHAFWGDAEGFYFTPERASAQDYADGHLRDQGAYDTPGNVVPAYLSIKNPFTIDRDTFERRQAPSTEELKARGHDGVIVTTPYNGAIEEIVAFEPTQIKSVNNAGTFSPTDPRIMAKLRTEDSDAAFRERAQEVGTRLRDEMNRLGLEDVGLRISETLTMMVDGKNLGADGLYVPGLIKVALDAANYSKTLHHETIHALRKAFTDTEWAILERMSNKKWRDRYEIGRHYREQSDAAQTEEGIAEAFVEFKHGRGQTDGIIAKIFRKIDAILRAIERAFSKDARLADELFRKIDSGEIGRRERNGSGQRQDPMFQAAWHGTPHDFDQFSLDHMGKGEGAQAFGWGLYFAGKRAISEYYRDKLSDKTLHYDGKDIAYDLDAKSYPKWMDDLPPAVAAILEYADANGLSDARNTIDAYASDSTWAIGFGDERIEKATPAELKEAKAAVDKIERRSKGKLFKVDLPEDSELMDWDAPLSEQSPEAREKLLSLFDDKDQLWIANSGWVTNLSALPEDERRITEKTARKLGGQFGTRREIIEQENQPGYVLYRDLARDLSDNLPFDQRFGNPDKVASEALRAAGIPGHRFLDSTSRASDPKQISMLTDQLLQVQQYAQLAKDPDQKAKFEAQAADLQTRLADAKANRPTHNYVIYDDSRISVEAKFQLKRQIPETDMPTAKWNDAKPVYVRVGDWDPKNPRSLNYAQGTVEDGLSVYDVDANDQPTIPDGEWTQQDMQERLTSDGPKYVVQGEVIGEGGDGEPLLRDPVVVGTYTHDDAGPKFRLRGLSGGIPPISTVTEPLSRRMVAFLKTNKNADEEGAIDLASRKLSDYLRPVLTLMRQSGVKDLPDAVNAYQWARLAIDAAIKRMGGLRDKYSGPMLEVLKEVGATMDELHDYALAKHAPERNRVVGLRNEEGSQFHNAVTDHTVEGASGWSTKKAHDVLKAFQKMDPKKFAGIKEAHRLLRAMLDEGLKIRLEKGLITQAQYDNLTKQFTNFVPLMGEEAMDGEGNGTSMPGRGSGFDVRGKEFKGATGRFSEAQNIPAWSIALTERAILRGEKNEIGKALLRFVNWMITTQGRNDIAEVYYSDDAPINDPSMDQIQKAPEVYRRELGKDGKVKKVKVPANTISPDMFATKVAGKTIYIKFADEKIGLALKNMSAKQLMMIFQISRGITNWQSFVSTRGNPVFVIRNLIKDSQTAFIHLLDENEANLSMAKAGMVLAKIPLAWQALWRAARGKPGSGAWDRALQEWETVGGKLVYDRTLNIEETIADLRKKVLALGKRSPGQKIVDWALLRGPIQQAFFRFINDLNDTVENGIRLSAYRTLRAKGWSPQKAALAVRNMTVDFRQHGEFGPTGNAVYAFFNAAIVGNVNVARKLKKSKRVRRVAYSMVAAGIAVDLLNRAMSGTGDDGEDEYTKMLRERPWLFERNIVIFTGPGKGDYFTIPVAYGYNPFPYVGTMVSAVAHGAMSPLEGMTSSLRVWMDAFNPMGGSGDWLNMITPTALDPIVEIDRNKNWNQTPIYPDKRDGDYTPDAYESFRSTPWLAKWVAEELNVWSGGNKVEPGSIDLHPGTVNHIYDFVTGGIGRFFEQLADPAIKLSAGEDPEWSRLPFVRDYYGTNDSDDVRKSEFYNAREKVEEVEQWRKKYIDMGDAGREDKKRMEAANPAEVDSIGAFNAASKQLTAINKRRRNLEGQKDISAAERKRKSDDIDQDEKDAMNRARTAYVKNRLKKKESK